MRTIVVVITLSLALSASGCLSAFPPSSLDFGRGPQPLERGTLRVQAGGGGGVAPSFLAGGAAVGARAELQVSEHIAVGVDGGAGAQVMPLALVAPFGGHFSLQANPGLDWLALRGSAGLGADVTNLGLLPTLLTIPWVSAAGSVVLGPPSSWMDTSTIEPWLSLNLGMRRYIGVTEGLGGVRGETGAFDTVYAGGATLGAAWNVTDVLSLYGAANGSVVVVTGAPNSPFLDYGLSPVASLQGGVAFRF